MAQLKSISANLNAFLDTLAFSEGTSTSKLTKNDGYDVIVTGVSGSVSNPIFTPEVFTDYSQHPFVNRKAKQINYKGLFSTASGRYQFMLKDWVHYRDQLGLMNFGPESQDIWAIQLIRERRALPLIEAGKFRLAVAAVSNLWASLPGANYKDQAMHNIEKLESIYLLKGGSLWDSNSSSVQLSPQSPVSSEPTKSVPIKPNQKPIPTTELQTTMPKLNGFWTLIKKLLKSN